MLHGTRTGFASLEWNRDTSDPHRREKAALESFERRQRIVDEAERRLRAGAVLPDCTAHTGPLDLLPYVVEPMLRRERARTIAALEREEFARDVRRSVLVRDQAGDHEQRLNVRFRRGQRLTAARLVDMADVRHDPDNLKNENSRLSGCLAACGRICRQGCPVRPSIRLQPISCDDRKGCQSATSTRPSSTNIKLPERMSGLRAKSYRFVEVVIDRRPAHIFPFHGTTLRSTARIPRSNSHAINPISTIPITTTSVRRKLDAFSTI
ncbi:hypothetical protein C7405_104301 [Paraburkholderia caballeronis]|nr:hypothetical protein C7405_104301 [Paraburkholderia caballeronis]